MAQSSDKKNTQRSQTGRQAHKGPVAGGVGTIESSASSAIPGGLFAIGIIGLLAALFGSGMLAYQHLSGLSIPGCGPGSGCAEAAASWWGSVPGIGWPTSHVGLAFFIALAIGWLISKSRGVSNAFLWSIRLGVVGSIVLTIAMFANGYICKYCLLAHAGNLLFWLSAEMARRRTGGALVPSSGALAVVVVFVLATVAMIPVEKMTQGRAEEQAEEQLAESTEKIIYTPVEEREVFTGRYLLGPEKAAIRIVALTDYQCPDCRNFETELRGIMENRDDISLSVKHFPMSSTCNKHMQGTNMHPNACWAARAAEAAGILRGNEGFWEMHFFQFDHGGEFTDATLPEYLRELGYDPQEFIKVLTSEETLKRVQSDIEEGVSLGMHFTPMVFINGVELRGAHFQGNLTRAIDRITAEQPEPMTVAEAFDTPPTAEEKYVEDWKIAYKSTIPPDSHEFPIGSDDPKADVVVWGDYQFPLVGQVNTAIRNRMAKQDGIRYSFRHYPINTSCNAYTEVNKHPNACMAAKAVEAAGILGGSDVWWSVHDAMFNSVDRLNETVVASLARNAGLDAGVHAQYMNSQRVDEAIAEDTLAGKQRALTSVPWVVINGRVVPRVTMEGQVRLDLIFDDILGPVDGATK